MLGRTRRLAVTEGITAGVLFGIASILIRLLQNLDLFSIAFWRLIIASLALAATILVIGHPFSVSLFKKNLKDLFVLSFFLGLHFIFFISAVKNTTILNATVLVNTTPIFSMLVSSFLFRLKPSRFAVFGLATSFMGICVIAYAESAIGKVDALQSFTPSLIGDFEAVLAALVEAFYLSYGKRIRSQMTPLSTMFPLYMLTAVIVGFLGVSATGKIFTFPSEIAAILPLVGLGILPTAMAHTLYFSSLSNLKSFETATMALLEPIGATFLGMILFQEMPSYLFVFGAALILMGIIFTVKEAK